MNFSKKLRFPKKITILLKKKTILQEKFFLVEEELDFVDIDGIGNV